MTRQQPLSPGKYLLQIEDYERLAEAGVFTGHRTELIGGDVIVMSPQFRPHGMTKMRLFEALRDGLRTSGSPLYPVIEFSLALSPDTMPDPDVMLTTEPDGTGAVPVRSVPLVIEVADTTLANDLGTKQRLYARAGIPEYWVADVNGRVIHQMWVPAGDDYGERRVVPFGVAMAAETVAGLTIDTGGL